MSNLSNSYFLKFFYLVLIFIFILTFNYLIFLENIFTVPLLLYSIFIYLIIFINFYVLFFVLSFQDLIIKLFLLLLGMIVMYFISLYLSTIPLAFLKDVYPNNIRIQYYYNTVYINKIEDLFSITKFPWMTSQLYFHLILLTAGFIMDKYMNSIRNIMELKVANANLELDILKSQIHPHFLFNTLNNLYRLVMKDELAGEVVLKLSDLLRFTLYESNVKFIPLKSEVKFLEDYIELEKIRHHNYVMIEYDFNDIENDEIQIAPLLFINFVENSFKHGVNKTRGSSWVKIKLSQKSEDVRFYIVNSIPLANIATNVSGGKGINNISSRLKLLYPGKHLLNIENDKDMFTVHLKIKLT